MSKTEPSLKSKNSKYLGIFIGVNIAIFLSVSIGGQLNYSSVEYFWGCISAKDGLITLCMPFACIILNGMLGDISKARIVFWRWKNPLPGCRAFSDLVKSDPRIDIATLRVKHGVFPRSPEKQNALWYGIYKKYTHSITVTDAHRNYLLTRDISALSIIFVICFPILSAFLALPFQLSLIYTVFLLIQYLITSKSARNYGRRFVLNVLTEDSHSK